MKRFDYVLLTGKFSKPYQVYNIDGDYVDLIDIVETPFYSTKLNMLRVHKDFITPIPRYDIVIPEWKNEMYYDSGERIIGTVPYYFREYYSMVEIYDVYEGGRGNYQERFEIDNWSLLYKYLPETVVIS